VIQKEVDAKEFGFDRPAAELELQVKGEPAPYSLRVGSAKAVGPNAYIETSSSPKTVFMVANYFPAMIQKDLFHWRNKRIFPEVTADMMNMLQWNKKGGAEFSATKVANTWTLEKPVKAPANYTLLEGLLTSVVYLDMKGVYVENRRASALKNILAAKPEWSLKFQKKTGEIEHLSVYAKPNAAKGVKEYVAHKPGDERLFLLDGSVMERFNKPAIEYRDRQLIPEGQISNLSEVVFRFPREKKEITLKLEQENWVYASGEKPVEALSRSRLDSFFRQLYGAEATSFVTISSDPVLSGFAKNPADLELEMRDSSKELRRFRFTVHNRKEVLTEGPVKGELAAIAGSFLKVMPVRFSDLYESSNKQVVTSPDATEEQNGEHSHAEHHH
jgi:hypothetical protein